MKLIKAGTGIELSVPCFYKTIKKIKNSEKNL